MRIYIDGELKRTATMKGPNLSEVSAISLHSHTECCGY